MTETVHTEGSCLCGAVAVHARKVTPNVGACHCGTCRTWAGGPFMSVSAGTDVSFDGEADITVYESSAWGERGFCRRCGSHLFFRMKGDAPVYYLPVGLFDVEGSVTFATQIFIDKKPSYYAFANQTQTLTEAEVQALHAS